MKDHEAMMQALLAGETLEVPGLYNMKVTDGMVRWEKENTAPDRSDHPMFTYIPASWQVKPKDPKDLEIVRLRRILDEIRGSLYDGDFAERRNAIIRTIDQALSETVSKE